MADTTVGDVRGQEGFYHYRQYSAVELAEKRTLEDVWHLLFEGALPTTAQRAKFTDEIRPLRTIPDAVRPLLPAIATAGGASKGSRADADFVPLDALRTAVSALGQALDFKASLDVDAATLRANAIQVCVVVPTLVMSLYRLNKGQEPIEPRDDLNYRGQLPLHAHG